MKSLFLSILLFLSSPAAYSLPQDTTAYERLHIHTTRYPIEKLYVHKDRSIYYAGETIWFKVYRMISSSAFGESGIVYVDLSNRNGDIVAQAKFPLEKGEATGQFSLDKELPDGTYRLRAYTRWMQNFSPKGFFYQTLKVKNPPKSSRKPFSKTNTPLLRFFPEGGNLVSGLASKVAFEISGTDPEKNWHGFILDEKNDTLQSFHSRQAGQGTFFFKPEAGKKYHARLEGVTERFDFPACHTQGFVINVKHLSEVLRITLSHNYAAGNQPSGCLLLLHQDGEPFAQMPIDCFKSYQHLDLPLDKLPTGVFTLTLMDECFRVYGERLLFARYPETFDLKLSAVCTREEGHRKMTVKLDAPQGTKLSGGSFSVAVVDARLEDWSIRHNIHTYFHLGSELSEEALLSKYFWSPNDSKSLGNIDLLLLTQGWRRYSLTEIARPLVAPAYPMESSLTLSGKVHGLPKKQVSSTVLQVLLRQNFTQQMLFCPIDKEKHFHLSGLSFRGEQDVLLSVRNEFGKEFPITVDSLPSAPVVTPIFKYNHFLASSSDCVFSSFADTLSPYTEEDMQSVRLDEVNITGRKRKEEEPRRLYTPDFAKFSYKPEPGHVAGDIRQLLRKVPGTSMVQNPKNLFSPLVHIDGTPSKAVAKFVVDGYLIHDQEMVYDMDASNVERIDVLLQTNTVFGGFNSGNGIIAIYTRSGNQQDNTPPTRTVMKWMGYTQTKEFYTPVANDPIFFVKPRQRHTLYWNPSLTLDDLGKNEFSFFLNDAETEDCLIHCEGRDGNGRTVVGKIEVKLSNM